MAEKNISARVPQEIFSKLDRQAAELGIKRGTRIRLILVDYFERPEAYTEKLEKLEDQLHEIRSEQRQLAEDLANAVKHLLVCAGHETEPKADRWVREKMTDRHLGD